MKKLILLVSSAVIFTACTQQPVKTVATGPVVKTLPYLKELQQGIAIYFKNNSTQITDQDLVYVGAAAEILLSNPRAILYVTGHTDSTGNAAVNKRVSMQRANTVKTRLITQYNVSPNQVIAEGAASAQPIADNSTAEGRAKNRRVTLALKLN